jgi:hypothetical protein
MSLSKVEKDFVAGSGAFCSFPIIVNQYMEANTWSMHDGAIYADSMQTIENALNHEFLKACGIASEKPRYISLPDFLP